MAFTAPALQSLGDCSPWLSRGTWEVGPALPLGGWAGTCFTCCRVWTLSCSGGPVWVSLPTWKPTLPAACFPAGRVVDGTGAGSASLVRRRQA